MSETISTLSKVFMHLGFTRFQWFCTHGAKRIFRAFPMVFMTSKFQVSSVFDDLEIFDLFDSLGVQAGL